MASQSSREKILSRIRSGLEKGQVSMPFPEAEKVDEFYTREETSLEEKFAMEFGKLGGKFVYCADEEELVSQLEILREAKKWKSYHLADTVIKEMFEQHGLGFSDASQGMETIESAVTLTDCLVARTGSVIMSSAGEHGRALPVYTPVHIVVAFADQLVWDISDAIQHMQTHYSEALPSMISLTTGPSRTADIEKTLVVGVHGPKEVYVFFLDQVRKK